MDDSTTHATIGTLGIPPCPPWVDLRVALAPEFLENVQLVIVDVLETYRVLGPRLRSLASLVARMEDSFATQCDGGELSDEAHGLLAELSGLNALADAWALLTGQAPTAESYLTEVGMAAARRRFGVVEE